MVENATDVTADSVAWSDSWYVVTGEVTIGQRVAVTGDVHLILTDGCSLTVNGGIGLSNADTNITIYGQQAGTGTLTATADGDNSSNAGIGSNMYGDCGNITINGGTVTAISKNAGAGIGSGYGYDSSCKDIIINSGTVTAISEGHGAGIGSGHYADCGNITINGGIIENAFSRYSGAGIGSGYGADCGSITISGGIIENAVH